MGKQEEERLEMTNGTEGRRQEREVSPTGAQDVPEIGGKGKGGGFFHVRFVHRHTKATGFSKCSIPRLSDPASGWPGIALFPNLGQNLPKVLL